MKREAVVLYLEQIIDLEVAKRCLMKRYQEEKNRYVKIKNSLSGEPGILAHRKEPSKQYLNCALLFGVFSGFTALMILAINATADMVWSYRGFGAINISVGPPAILYFLVLVAGIGTIYWFGRFASSRRSYRTEMAEWKAYETSLDSVNRREIERARRDSAKLEELNAEWEKLQEHYSSEEKRLKGLLERLYNFNIIPKQHRELPSLFYIYDYMKTSEETLTDALHSQQFEAGVNRIVACLHDLMNEIRKTLGLLQENNAGQNMIVSQNIQMLNRLQQIEENAMEAARYAEQVSCYTKANALFTLADYLDEDD